MSRAERRGKKELAELFGMPDVDDRPVISTTFVYTPVYVHAAPRRSVYAASALQSVINRLQVVSLVVVT